MDGVRPWESWQCSLASQFPLILFVPVGEQPFVPTSRKKMLLCSFTGRKECSRGGDEAQEKRTLFILTCISCCKFTSVMASTGLCFCKVCNSSLCGCFCMDFNYWEAHCVGNPVPGEVGQCHLQKLCFASGILPIKFSVST